MRKVLIIASGAFALIASLLVFPDGVAAMGLATILSILIAFYFSNYYKEDSEILIDLFLVAVLLRLVLGLFVHVFDLRGFFGGDAGTYDLKGWLIVNYWQGNVFYSDPYVQNALATSGSGWGMNYLTAVIYYVIGRNIYAAQTVCAVFGALTAPLTYICAYKSFNNSRVSKTAAWLAALFPAFIVWSGQLLKDGLIVTLLLIVMIVTIELQKKIRIAPIIILILGMFGILSLRFYIFFMLAAAVVGGFVIGQSETNRGILQRLAVLVILGLGLTYVGVLGNADRELDTFGNLERIQQSRSDLAVSAESGFGEDSDVSTASGAISALPIGLTYLMLAPFPWQVSSLRAAITMPEVFFWWCLIPFLISGLIYSMKNRLRKTLPILIFTLMLTLAYSVFQGNVGTAYRQRTQIQVFLFMYIAVGWIVYREKKENAAFLYKSTRK